MTTVDATGTFLGAAGTHALLDFVSQHRHVEDLRLPKNGVDLECIRHLCDVLQSGAHPRLHHVDLRQNDLTIPSMRLLWQTACAVPTLTSVLVADCGVEEGWVDRLGRATAANAELQRAGYVPCRPPRVPAGSWRTVFVLLLGAPHHTARYTQEVLPVVASYAAPLRVRLAPLVLQQTDTRERVKLKLCRCQETRSDGSRTWCVVLADAAHPLSEVEQYALKKVLSEGPLPAPMPLRDREGRQRPPTPRLAQTCFVYYANPANAKAELGSGVEALPPRKWLRMTGLGEASAEAPEQEAELEVYGELVQEPACVLSDASYQIRCQSDLLVSLETMYTEHPPARGGGEAQPQATASDPEADASDDAGPGEHSCKADLLFEALHPRACAAVRSFLLGGEESDLASTPSPPRVNVPLVLYGCRDVGKSGLASYVARACAAASPPSPSAAAPPPRRVVEVDVGTGNRSLIILLWRVLAVFARGAGSSLLQQQQQQQQQQPPPPRRRRPFPSVLALSAAVREAIKAYDGPALFLLLPRMDTVDSCGLPMTAVVEWLPTSFPSNVRCVLTLATDSPLLSALRQRAPQPQELLVPPFSEKGRLSVFKTHLSRWNVLLPGLTADDGEAGAVMVTGALTTDPSECTATERAYLAKDGATSLLYARLAAAHVRATLALSGGDSRVSSRRTSVAADAAEVVEEQLPGTVEEVVVALATAAEATCDAITVRCVLGCLCVAPLPVPGLQSICEGIGGCAPQTTVSAVLDLVEAGLVTWRPDSTVYIEEATTRAALLDFLGDSGEGVERYAAMVESYLYRIVTTRSPEATEAFRYLVPIMVDGGNFELASSLLLANTPVLDGLLYGDAHRLHAMADGGEAPNQLYILDGLFRLLVARELLLQLVGMASEEEAGPTIAAIAVLDEKALLRAVVDIQRLRDDRLARAAESTQASGEEGLRDDLYQCGVWRDGSSPFAVDARRRLPRPPYPVLVPTNAGHEDEAVVHLNCDGAPCRFLHCTPTAGTSGTDSGCVAATTTTGAIYVFSLDSAASATAQEPFAKLPHPLPKESDEVLVGALAAADRRLVVAAATSVTIWNLDSQVSTVLPNLCVDVSSSCMNAFGTQIIATQPWVSHVATGSSHGEGGGGGGAFRSTYCIVDLTRRAVVRRLPCTNDSTAWHRSFFSGNNAVVVEGSVLYRFSNETEPCGEATALLATSNPPLAMRHDALVDCAASNEDGRLLATSTGSVLWLWIAAKGELLHRIDTPHSTITALCLNPSGSHLLCHQPEGLYLWRTATGTRVAPVQNPFAPAAAEHAGGSARTGSHPLLPHVGTVGFFGDGTRLYGCIEGCGVVWDALSLAALAAVPTPCGLVSALCERGGRLYVASTTAADVQVFASPLPTVQQVETGTPLTTNLLQNAKVSLDSIQEVSVDPSASTIACLDSHHRLHVFSLRTGEPIAWSGDSSAEAEDGEVAVASAALLNASTLLFAPVRHDARLQAAAVYTVSFDSSSSSSSVGSAPAQVCLLPRELVYTTDTAAAQQPRLVVRAADSEVGARFAGVEYSYHGHSRLMVLVLESDDDDDSAAGRLRCRLHCQLVGHSGPMLRGILFGSFAFTVGAEDDTVRLWSLSEQHKGAERTCYRHPCSITAVAVDPGSPGVLLLLDAAGAVHRVCVGSITSPTRACFLVETLQLPSLRAWAGAAGPVVGAVAVPPSLLCVRGATGAVALTGTSRDQRVITVRPDSACRTLTACRLRGEPFVILGLSDGRVVLSRVHQSNVRKHR